MTVVEEKIAVEILQPLDRLRGMLRRYIVVDGLLYVALAVAVWCLLGMLFDYGVFLGLNFDWVLDAPKALRILALALLVIVVVGILVISIGMRVGKSLSYSSLAMVLEKRFPTQLGERLITSVELADIERSQKQGYSLDMIRRTILDASDRLEDVPLKRVFNQKRLRWKTLLAVGLMLATFLAVVAISTLRVTSVSPLRVVHETADVLTIWVERNLLLMNTPWPRSTYLEVLEPTATELRVGKDAASPRVRVRAAEWVVRDANVRDGWRAMTWLEASRYAGAESLPTTLDVTTADEWPTAVMARAGVVGGWPLVLESSVAVKTVNLNAMTVDEVAQQFGTDHEKLVGVFQTLATASDDPANSRSIRRLPIPDAMSLNFYGITKSGDKNESRSSGGTRGELRLTREPSGDFTTDVTGLKESVAYNIRARDFRTATREIVLVPPPMLTKLSRTESQPAYIFYPPALDGTKGPVALLPSQVQVLAGKEFSLTGERSLATVPVGTELEITGVADKPLAEVLLVPKTGKLPTAMLKVQPEGEKFTLRFTGVDRVMTKLEFDIILVDGDGVRAKRLVLIQVTEDQPPQVEFAVDVLRKVGNSWMCTTRAMVPFVKESLIRDDYGLNRVEYEFSVSRLEAQAVVGLQVQALATAFAATPLVGSFSAAATPTVSLFLMKSLSSGEQRQFATQMVLPFERAFDAIPKLTVDSLKAKLAVAHPNPELPTVVKDVKFTLDADYFDLEQADRILEARGRKMRVADSSGEVQPRYRMELNIVATDSNVLTGPKVGRNLEPIRLLIVSEADLLGEITKDEESITQKFDEALRRLRDAQGKLNQQADRLQSASLPPDIMLAARVRAEDISQDVNKARDLEQFVVNEYSRLRREVETNRCNEAVPRRYQNVIISPLEQVLAGEQKAAEDAMTAFRDPLLEGRKPEDAITFAAKQNLQNLITRLERIRRELGDSLSEGKLRDDLRKIIENQTVVSKAFEGIMKRSRELLFAPEIRSLPNVELAVGETKKLVQEIDWKLFDKGELRIRVEYPAGGELTGPTEIIAKDERNDFEYSIKAGTKPGSYKLKLTPNVGNSVVLSVTVK
jgi:hypothetical protein